MHLQPLPALEDNYIWLLANARGQALVVDPGEAEPVRRALTGRGLRLQAILLTHHHLDHTGGVETLCEQYGARVFGPWDERIAHVDQRVDEGDFITPLDDANRFRVLTVPGHTRSHLAYVGAGVLFCGDTLFSLGCGRLFEGTPAQMLNSLDQLAALPADIGVCCGHEYTLANAAFAQQVDPDNPALARRVHAARQAVDAGLPTLPSTLAQERATNPFLRSDSPALVAWATRQGIANDRVARFAALRAAKDGFTA